MSKISSALSVALAVGLTMFSQAYGQTKNLAEWLTNAYENGSWVKGDLPRFANEYKAKFANTDEGHRARILHAITTLLATGESDCVATLFDKFGLELSYEPLEYSGDLAAISEWASGNELMDLMTPTALAALETAIEDLDGIPSTWSGSLTFDSKDIPYIDEPITVDIGDVLYVKAMAKSAYGAVLLVKSYNLASDSKQLESDLAYPTIKALTSKPSINANVWNSIEPVKLESNHYWWYGQESTPEIKEVKLARYKNNLYLRFTKNDADMQSMWGYLELGKDAVSDEDIEIDFYVSDYYGSGLSGDYHLDGCWDKSGELTPEVDGNTILITIDCTEAENPLSSCCGLDYIEFSTGYNYYENEEPINTYTILNNQKTCFDKVRDSAAMSKAKSVLTEALNIAKAADAKVSARRDNKMHLINYDEADAEDLAQAREALNTAIESMSKATTVKYEDVEEDVYLGAIFSGKVVRGLIPESARENEYLPNLETIPDPTFGGVFPKMTKAKLISYADEFELDYAKPFTYMDVPGGVEITGVEIAPKDGNLVIPSTIDGKKVVSIGVDAFNPDDDEDRVNMTTLTIPKTVTNITYASLGCNTSLTKIIVEAGNPKYSTADNGRLLLELSGSDYAVIQAASYPNGTITIPEGVVAICYEAFADMKIGNIVFPSTLVNIDSGAFNSIEGVTELDFSGTRLNSIGHKAFEDHTSIQTLKFPATLENIGSFAFADNKALKSVYFLGGIPSVDEGIFTDTANVVVYVGANKGWDDYATGGTKWNGATVSYDPNYKAFVGTVYGFWADSEEGDIWKYEDCNRESEHWMEEFANINGHKEPAQWACGEGDGFAIPVTVAAGTSVTPQIIEGTVSCQKLTGLTDKQMRDMICKDSDWNYDYYARELWPNGKTIDTRAWIVVVPNGINTSPKYRMNLLETMTMSGKESIKSYSERNGVTAPNYVDVSASVSFKVKIQENGAIFGERLWFVPAPYNYNEWYKKFVDTLEDSEEVDDIEEVMARGLWLVTPEMIAEQQAYKPTTTNISFAMPIGYRDEAYSFDHKDIDIGEFIPETVTISGLPSGVSFDNGIIKGKVSTTGTWNATVTFTNMYGDKIVATGELVIRPFKLEVSAEGVLSGIRGGLTSTGGKLTIPAEVDGITITAIADDAFAHCTDLKTVYFLGDKPRVTTSKLFKNAAEITVYVLPDQGWDDDVKAGTWQGAKIVYLATAKSVTATYDGKAHTIESAVATNAGAAFTYSTTTNGQYVATKPTFTKAGVYAVYYKLTLNGETICVAADTVTINPKPLTNAMVKDFDDIEYTGSALTPAVQFNDTLVTANDYTVSYANNVNYGTATVTITGKGNFSGTVTKTFKVAKVKIIYTATGYTGIYDGKAHGITVNVTKPASGAKVTYAATNARTDVGESSIGFAITADNFDAVENKSAIIKITPKTLTSAMVTPATISGTFVENGKPITPAVKVVDGTILKASDYVVTYENNVSHGTATIKITAKGNYTGVVTRTFFIKGVMKKDAMSEKPLDEKWNGRWDGKPHGTQIAVTGVTGARVTYRTDPKQAWSTTVPTFTEVGTYTVYYKVEAEGWEAFEDSYTVTVLSQYDWISAKKDGVITSVVPAPKGDIVIPEEFDGIKLTAIASELFNGNKNLTSVKIPATILEIGNRAFAGCENLKSVTFEGDCPKCGVELYKDVKGVITYVTPDSTESWGGDEGDTERLPKSWMGRPIVYIGGAVPKDFNFVVGNYFGYEDNVSHTINITVFNPPADLEIVYRSSGDDQYSDKVPVFKNAGTYGVEFKISAKGYYSAKGEGTVVIEASIEAGKMTKDPQKPVAYGWLEANAAVLGLPAKPTAEDYEKAANKSTGKKNPLGGTFTAFEEYVMGTNPSDSNDTFRVSIETAANGRKTLRPCPKMSHRVYRYFYSSNLKDWKAVSEEEVDDILSSQQMAFFTADVDLDEEIKAAAAKVQNGVTGGDLDGNDEIDEMDLEAIKEIIWDLVYTHKYPREHYSAKELAAADVDNNGVVDEMDVIAIYNLIQAQK